MELRFALTAEDLIQYQQSVAAWSARRERLWKASRVLGWCFILGVGIMIAWAAWLERTGRAAEPAPGDGRKTSLLWVIITNLAPYLVIGVLVWLFVFRKRSYKEMATLSLRDRPEMAAPKTVVVLDEGLQVEEASSTTLMKWGHFSSVRQTPNLWLLHSSATTALIIPKRALASTEETDKFRALMMGRVGKPPANATG